MSELTQILPLLYKIVLAAFLGAMVGAERDISGKSAGLRTSGLIAIGSCLFTVISLEAAPEESLRIAAQIVTGVGFLGAGAMFKTENAVHGLTTAAEIWVVAAIGMAAGMGMELLAILSAIFVVAVMVLLKPLSKMFEKYGMKHET